MAALSEAVSYRISRYNIKKHALTTGQITASICQFVFSVWAFLNMVIYRYHDISSSTWQIESYLIGFYIYDLLHMLTYKEGRKLYIFHLHHIVAVAIIATFQEYPDIGSHLIVNTVLFLLEVSSLSVNITVLYKQFAPNHVQSVELINVVVYGITRIISFPSIIYVESYRMYIEGHLIEPQYAAPMVLLFLLHLLCIMWYKTMLTNFYERYINVTHNLELQPL